MNKLEQSLSFSDVLHTVDIARSGNDGLSGKVATGGHCTNIAEWVEFSVTGKHRDCQ